MARREKAQAESSPLVESAKLLEEAGAEIERLTKHCFELEKIAGQFGEIGDVSNLLWEARTIRLLADPEDGESVHAALQRRLSKGSELLEREPTVSAQIDLAAAPEMQKLFEDAQAEIEALQEKLGALPRKDDWVRICELCSAEDGEAVADTLQNVRDSLGEEYKDLAIDEAVDHAFKADEIVRAKAERLDEVEKGLGLEVADAVRKVFSSHACALRHAWLGLDVYEQKKIMTAMEEQIEKWIEEGCK